MDWYFVSMCDLTHAKWLGAVWCQATSGNEANTKALTTLHASGRYKELGTVAIDSAISNMGPDHPPFPEWVGRLITQEWEIVASHPECEWSKETHSVDPDTGERFTQDRVDINRGQA